MGVTSFAVTASTTRQQLGTARNNRRALLVSVDSGTAYVGGSNVTAASGLAVTPATSPLIIERVYPEDPVPGQPWYVIAASGTVACRVQDVTG